MRHRIVSPDELLVSPSLDSTLFSSFSSNNSLSTSRVVPVSFLIRSSSIAIVSRPRSRLPVSFDAVSSNACVSCATCSPAASRSSRLDNRPGPCYVITSSFDTTNTQADRGSFRERSSARGPIDGNCDRTGIRLVRRNSHVSLYILANFFIWSTTDNRIYCETNAWNPRSAWVVR